ncbi:MAG: DUF5063 domain-containing protein [Chloroflexi bacterium]|jgi:hypothetical protein|nr:DUF5063 domain-containing protein [Chloroflexota bacterium]
MGEWTLTPEVANFADNARRFCEFCEESHTLELGERLLRGAISLANLYSAGLFLREEAPPEERLHPQIEELRNFPGFDELTLFWQVQDAHEWSAPVVASLSELIVGIYRDVKRALVIFDKGYATGDSLLMHQAAWDWQYHMERTWGNRAVDALRGLHSAMNKLHSRQV